MKRIITAAVFSLVGSSALAVPVNHPHGPNLTYGAVSNNQSIMSSVTNPAAGASVFTDEDSHYGFGVLSSIGVGVEFGQMDDFFTQFNDTKDTLTTTQILNFANIIQDPNTSIEEKAAQIADQVNQTLINPTNELMTELAKDGYFKGTISGHAPIMPLVVTHKKLGGSFLFDINANVTTYLGLLADPINQINGQDILSTVQTAIDNNQNDINFDQFISSDSTAIVKGALVAEMSLGYSRSVWKHDNGPALQTGELFAGVRANYYRVGLTRFIQRLQDFTQDQSVDSVFSDRSGENYKESAGFGVDAGVVWVSKHYRAGATLNNITQPSFKYNSLNLNGYDPSTDVYAELSKGEEYKMNRQLTLEGAVFTSNQNWVVAGSLDANAVKDPVGQDYKWLALSAAYATKSWWIPGARVGFRSNLAGTKLNYVTAGTTLFKSLNLDIAYALNTVKVAKNDATSFTGEVPRSAIINLGLEFTF